jgi:hypothetical protein
MRNAADPIMMGKATAGLMPSALTTIIEGAYIPMPRVIRAPRTKLAVTAMPRPNPRSPSA